MGRSGVKGLAELINPVAAECHGERPFQLCKVFHGVACIGNLCGGICTEVLCEDGERVLPSRLLAPLVHDLMIERRVLHLLPPDDCKGIDVRLCQCTKDGEDGQQLRAPDQVGHAARSAALSGLEAAADAPGTLATDGAVAAVGPSDVTVPSVAISSGLALAARICKRLPSISTTASCGAVLSGGGSSCWAKGGAG
jgi:hypothetical protein